MRRKIVIYVIFVLLFVIGKFLFMSYYGEIYGSYTMGDWMSVIWHGLPHDLSCAGYLMALPFLLQLAYIWVKGDWHRHFMRFWVRFSLFLILLDFFCDLFLYGYWGFRLDTTALFYLLDNPVEALGQAPIGMLVFGTLALFACWWSLQWLICKLYGPRRPGSVLRLPSERECILHSVGALLSCGLLFLAIRGGVTPATMNVGRVYFSSEMSLNQAATNPFFSFIYSLSHKKTDFSKQYRFMSAEKAAAVYEELGRGNEALAVEHSVAEQYNEIGSENPDSSFVTYPASPDSLSSSLLKTQRPNIVLIILESFAGAACVGVYPEADSTILPNVNRMYREGIGFSNIFANSFRTDRGCASILASYPAQPTNSVMKDQGRCNHLQYLSKRLKENGYGLSFIHGGDVNFTNMRGFLTAGGFENIVGDGDFPVADRLSKWGVPDHLMFDYLYDQVVAERTEPYLKVMLTLSSHEPFDVPYHHFEDPYVNSVSYADSCLGSFVDRLKATPAWDSLLVIGIADHSFARYPAGIQNHEILRYRIPMFWTGGAVTSPCIVDTYGSQTDLSATLLELLEMDHGDFNFSKDLLDPSVGHYGFYTFSDGFGFVNDSISYVQDNANPGRGLSGTHDPDGKAQRWGKAYLQTLYDDLSKR